MTKDITSVKGRTSSKVLFLKYVALPMVLAWTVAATPPAYKHYRYEFMRYVSEKFTLEQALRNDEIMSELATMKLPPLPDVGM